MKILIRKEQHAWKWLVITDRIGCCSNLLGAGYCKTRSDAMNDAKIFVQSRKKGKA